MSRAFVKEGESDDDLPERVVSEGPNYVTPAGHEALLRRLDALAERRSKLAGVPGAASNPEFRSVERDLRYVEARLKSAVVVDRSKERPDDVRFGAVVELREDGAARRCQVVGEDEADPAAGKISWSSPLALALMGSRPGDEVTWSGPDGDHRVQVVSLSYG